MNREFPEDQAGFRKGRGTRDQIANIHWIIEKEREFQKNICFIEYTKDFDRVDHNKLWKNLQEMGIPDHLTCLLINLYAGQEATVRTAHGTMDWFQIWKGVHQGCILSPCLFNLYAEYIMLMPGWMKHKLESRLPGEISITADGTTLKAGSKDELKSHLEATVRTGHGTTDWFQIGKGVHQGCTLSPCLS